MSKEQPDSVSILQRRIKTWANKTLPERTVGSALRKLREEIDELSDSPDDPSEYADVIILVLDLAEQYGIDIVAAGNAKMDINESSEWTIRPDGIAKRIK